MEAKNSIFVVGCGRNGTSMTAGLFRNSGLFMGDQLHGPAAENPTGFFEDAGVNKVNNDIITRCLPPRTRFNGVEYGCDSPLHKGWLARLPLDQEFSLLPVENALIRKWTSSGLFCLKDTRFCYLLHLWRQHAPDAKVVCVFRPPAIAALSILNCCRNRPGLSHVAISVDQAFEIWTLCYQHVLERHAPKGEWLFIRYEDVLSGRALDSIEDFTGTAVDREFPLHSLNRTSETLEVPKSAARIYDNLLTLAATTD